MWLMLVAKAEAKAFGTIMKRCFCCSQIEQKVYVSSFYLPYGDGADQGANQYGESEQPFSSLISKTNSTGFWFLT